MEIAPIVSFSLTSVTGSTAGPAADPAFAAVLSAVGFEASAVDATSVPIATQGFNSAEPADAEPAQVTSVKPELQVSADPAPPTALSLVIKGDGTAAVKAPSLVSDEAAPAKEGLPTPRLPTEAEQVPSPAADETEATTAFVELTGAESSPPQSAMPRPVEAPQDNKDSREPVVFAKLRPINDVEAAVVAEEPVADAGALTVSSADQMSEPRTTVPVRPHQSELTQAAPQPSRASAPNPATTQLIADAASNSPAVHVSSSDRGSDAFAPVLANVDGEPAPIAAGAPAAHHTAVGQPVAAPPPSASQLSVSPAVPDAHSRTELHPEIAFRPDKVAREIGLEIARRVSAGSEELVIRLDPAELGRINIRMTVNEHGQLRAVVAADTAAVVDAIRNDLSELTRALEQAGLRTDSQSFRFDRSGGGDPGGAWQQRYQDQAAPRGNEPRGTAVTDDEVAYRPMATNGRVNMMA